MYTDIYAAVWPVWGGAHIVSNTVLCICPKTVPELVDTDKYAAVWSVWGPRVAAAGADDGRPLQLFLRGCALGRGGVGCR
jgi:hypothetical protein